MGGLKEHIGIIGYLLLVVAVAGGFLAVQQVQERVEREAYARAVVVCENNNEVKMIIARMLRQLFVDDADDFEELSEEDKAERLERIERLEKTILASVPCDEALEVPS